jgi:hypothetical protein
MSLPDSIRNYWDWNVRIRDFEQHFSADQPEFPHWNIDSHHLAPEGDDDVTEPMNDVLAFELILPNSFSDFRYSGKGLVIVISYMRLPFSDLFSPSSTGNTTTLCFIRIHFG